MDTGFGGELLGDCACSGEAGLKVWDFVSFAIVSAIKVWELFAAVGASEGMAFVDGRVYPASS